MRTTIPLFDGRKFWLENFTGEVIEDRKWSDTQVWSTHTAGYTIPGQYNSVHVPGQQQIHSKTSEYEECWLRAADGEERMFRFDANNKPPSYRTGHPMSVVYGGLEGTDKQQIWGIKNHKTGDGVRWGEWPQDLARVRKAGLDVEASGVWYALQVLLALLLLLSIIGIPILVIWVYFEGQSVKRKVKPFMEKLAEELDTTFKPHMASEVQKLAQSRSTPVNASAPPAGSY